MTALFNDKTHYCFTVDANLYFKSRSRINNVIESKGWDEVSTRRNPHPLGRRREELRCVEILF